MGIASGIVLYMVIWAITFFIVLPFGQVSQHEAGEVVPGTPASAPSNAQMGRKILLTTVIAAVVWVLVASVIHFRLITVDDIPFLTPPSLR